MKVSITAGAGYIGSHTAKTSSRAGVRAIVVDNLGRGHWPAVRWGAFVEADIGDRRVLREIFEHSPFEGVNNTLSRLESMRTGGVKKIVFSSNCATYGHPQRIPIPDDYTQQLVNPCRRVQS